MLNDEIGRFLWLTKQALGGVFYGWPVSLVLLLLLVISTFFQFSSLWNKYRLKTLILLTPFTISIIILFMGAFCLRFSRIIDDPYQKKSINELLYIVFGLLFSHIILGVYFSIRFKPFWLFVIVLTLFQLWLSFWASFIAAMAIGGDWI